MAEDLALVLEQLADESRPVNMTNLAALSDMTRNQIALFRAAWANYSPQRQVELAQALVEKAEENIHLNFINLLRDLLYDANAQVRKLAIDGLWEDDRPALVAPLVKLLRDDPVPEVRAAAAMALGRFVLLGVLDEIAGEPAEQAEEALREAWYRPHEATDVRRRALEGLAYSDLPDVRELIQLAYYDEDELLRQSAIFAMGRSADRRWSRYVLAELNSHDAPMRFEAAVAAGEMGLSTAVVPLIRLLDDADINVREAAAEALGQIGGPAAKRALETVVGGSDEGLALAAEAALEELNFNTGRYNDSLLDFSDQLMAPGDGEMPDELEDADEFDLEVNTGDGYGDEGYDDDETYDYDADEVDWLDVDDEQDEDDEHEDW